MIYVRSQMVTHLFFNYTIKSWTFNLTKSYKTELKVGEGVNLVSTKF